MIHIHSFTKCFIHKKWQKLMNLNSITAQNLLLQSYRVQVSESESEIEEMVGKNSLFYFIYLICKWLWLRSIANVFNARITLFSLAICLTKTPCASEKWYDLCQSFHCDFQHPFNSITKKSGETFEAGKIYRLNVIKLNW